MAQASGLNVNTVRAVYQRLEQKGLIDSQQGSGTFVASAPPKRTEATTIAAGAAQEARETGVDPRDVAAALYVSADTSGAAIDAATAQRRELRNQIAALERAVGELESRHPGVVPRSRATRRGIGPTLLSNDGLERVRAQVVRRLAVAQAAIDAHFEADRGGRARTSSPRGSETGRRVPRGPSAEPPAERPGADIAGSDDAAQRPPAPEPIVSQPAAQASVLTLWPAAACASACASTAATVALATP